MPMGSWPGRSSPGTWSSPRQRWGTSTQRRPGLETVVGSGDRFVYLLDKDGAQLWKRPTGWIVRSSPLLADLDGNGDLEILSGSDDHRVWAWHHDGSRVDRLAPVHGRRNLLVARLG